MIILGPRASLTSDPVDGSCSGSPNCQDRVHVDCRSARDQGELASTSAIAGAVNKLGTL
jgi:hypothetical protein